MTKYYYRTTLLLTLIIFLGVISCTQNRSDDNQNEDTNTALESDPDLSKIKSITETEEFNEFYLRFNQDLEFQKSRIEYPLEGEYVNGEIDVTKGIEYTWTKKDSLVLNTLEIDTTLYTKERLFKVEEVVEQIFIENSGFQVKLVFRRIEGKWYLVFYSDISM